MTFYIPPATDWPVEKAFPFSGSNERKLFQDLVISFFFLPTLLRDDVTEGQKGCKIVENLLTVVECSVGRC